MPKQELLDGLVRAIKAAGWTAKPLAGFPTADIVLRTPCFAAFFAVAEPPQRLEAIYKEAQSEIAKACGEAAWPRDLELVLFVAGEKPPDPALVRRITDDRYVCRKFVLYPNGRHVDELLADLPFWPPDDLLAGVPTLVGAGVQEAVTGYDPRLIADLASHSPGVERVFEKIREGEYSLTGEVSSGKTVPAPRVAPPTPTRLEALDITDFRGIRRLRPEDMSLSGDVVFIYGPNGVGKTSIADALEWAITGQVNRLEQRPFWSARGGPDPVVNVFSNTGGAEVVCRLSNREPICRTKRGRSTERLIGSRRAADDHAVIDHVVGTKAPSSEARLRIEKLRDLFRGSHMLSQHDIRQFLERTEPAERFDILTDMIGADEFVRFREKAAAVSRHLRSHVRAFCEDAESLRRELDDVSTRLRERQGDLEKLRQVVAADKTPDSLVAGLLAGLRNCHCTIDEALVQRAESEPADRRFEIISVHAETVIRGKRTEIEDLLVRLNGLEQGLNGYAESCTQCERLAAEIASAKTAAEKTGADLQRQETTLQSLRAEIRRLETRQSEAARHYANMAWLRENLPAYAEAKGSLVRVEDALAGQRKELRTLEDALEERQRAHEVKRGRLQEVEQAVAAKTSREQALAALLERMPGIRARRQEAEQLNKRERLIDSQMGGLRDELSRAQKEVNTARALVTKAQGAYDTESTRYDVLNSFLARVAELVHSAECPLCGRRFSSADEAKASIQEHLSCVPPELRNLARQLDEAKKDAEAKQARANSTGERIHALETESEQLRSARAAATQAVQDFLAECAALAVVVSAGDPPSWQSALEQALRECDTAALRSEAASLRDAINALASGLQQQRSVVDGLRRRLAQNERGRAQQLSTIQGLEADVVQRGFEPRLVPESDKLAADLEKAREATRKLGESIVKKKGDLQTAESNVTGLRERVRRACEDVASKEAQLRGYESARDRFVAECRSAGIDPGNPKEGIGVVRRSAMEEKKALASLEKTRQVLQQLVSLERLKHEIEGLSRQEGEVRQRTEANAKEESRLREWLSCIEGLEAEVVRQQVSVVGAHLERVEPTTQRLYHRLNPHPIFGTVKIRVDEETRKLDVIAEASLASERLREMAVSPSAFFSDAQMNALAVTVFLAGTLRQRWSALKTILIDDPVQQMDEMNVCAFLDLVRGLSTQRQFVIFTCSRDFYLLALDKLDCLNKLKSDSFLAYRLEGIAPAELKVHRDA